MTAKELADRLGAAEYRFAKTMPENPHHYTLRRTWACAGEFEVVVAAIRVHGTSRRWMGHTYIYFEAEGYQYWTMGAAVTKTTLINRAKT